MELPQALTSSKNKKPNKPTTYREREGKEKKPTQGHFAETSATRLLLSKRHDGSEP